MEIKLGQEKEGMFEFIKTKEQKFFFFYIHGGRNKGRGINVKHFFFINWIILKYFNGF